MVQLNFLFGLGIFLLGMTQLEYGIHQLGAARLRTWLRSSSRSTLGSVSTGVLTTAILQSSSLVSLLVLAFASAGLLPLVNAIAIILGANLGTTATGWIVTVLGFKLNLEAMAIPLMGITAFVMAVSRRDSRVFVSALTVFGLALLLFGLGLMKTSMEALPERFDIALIQGHHPAVYFLVGVLLAALIQSSSAVMMMTLAALHADLIAYPEAVALIIGADLGTTSTTVLASLTGSTVKRELAFAHFAYNLVVDISAFLILLAFIPEAIPAIVQQYPLYSLVAFHSLMNLMGLIVFLPFLRLFANWIERLFAGDRSRTATLLERVPPQIAEAALAAMRDTVKLLILQAACNGLRLFGLKPEKLRIIEQNAESIGAAIDHQDFIHGYEELKNQEGKLLSYSMQVQAQPLNPDEAVELERLQVITRNAVFSNKNLKDIQQDLQDTRMGSTASMTELYESHRQFQKATYENFIDLLLGDHSKEFVLEQLKEIEQQNYRHTDESNRFVQAHIGRDFSNATATSIQFNLNLEVRNATNILIRALRLWAGAGASKSPVDAIEPELVS